MKGQRMRTKGNTSGIAMITVLLFLVFMMIIGGLVMFTVTTGIQMSGSSRRDFSAFEAAESGLDWGMVRIEDITNTGAALVGDTLDIDNKDVEVGVVYLFSAPVAGSNIAFAAGYEGIGKGLSSGGTAVSFRVASKAPGSQQENIALEVAYRKIVGVQAR